MPAKRDDNRVPAIQGISNADGITPIDILVDAITKRLLVSGIVSISGETLPSLQTRSDWTSGDLDYKGFAERGIAESATGWTICKFTWTSGNQVSMQIGEGKWSERATVVVYS